MKTIFAIVVFSTTPIVAQTFFPFPDFKDQEVHIHRSEKVPLPEAKELKRQEVLQRMVKDALKEMKIPKTEITLAFYPDGEMEGELAVAYRIIRDPKGVWSYLIRIPRAFVAKESDEILRHVALHAVALIRVGQMDQLQYDDFRIRSEINKWAEREVLRVVGWERFKVFWEKHYENNLKGNPAFKNVDEYLQYISATIGVVDD